MTCFDENRKPTHLLSPSFSHRYQISHPCDYDSFDPLIKYFHYHKITRRYQSEAHPKKNRILPNIKAYNQENLGRDSEFD
jgi:hypothetical protein